VIIQMMYGHNLTFLDPLTSWKKAV